MVRILIAEDNDDLRGEIERCLRRRGFETTAVADGAGALAAVGREGFNLALVDLRMPQVDGLEVIQKCRKLCPKMQVIIMTGHASVENAVEAIHLEVADYLIKPFGTAELEAHIDRLLRRHHLGPYAVSTIGQADATTSSFIGDSHPMQRVRELARRVAQTPSPVLLLGESGAGKEVLAQEIHRLSPRRDNPFVAVNCVALAEGVLESELFGHEKGSFTGASAQKLGLLEVAGGGTVFLDEIGEIAPNIQVKLLRFLQEHEIQRVGSTRTIKVDARIIAASNRDLHAEVAACRFRQDLLYRLNAFEIYLPPLRDHMEDLPDLIDRFLVKYGAILDKKAHISAEATTALKEYHWPGNIRELEHVIERALILTDNGVIEYSDLPPRLTRHEEAAPARRSDDSAANETDRIREIESGIIRRALEENNWNQARTARQLGIKRTTLQYRMQKYCLVVPKKTC